MKNTFKRIAVIALAVVMCVSAAVPAFAAGNACPGTDKQHTAFNCTYVEANKQEATCTAAGFVTGKCTTCSAIFSVSQTEALGHTWETPDAICGSVVYKTCTVCGAKDDKAIEREHLYTAWTLTEGTCGTANARITRTCVYCDETEVDKLGDEGHIFSLVSYIAPAKCGGVGVANYECVVAGCEAVKVADVYDTTDEGEHSFVAWAEADDDLTNGKKDPNAKKATCADKGRASMICEYCEKIVVVTTPKEECDVDATEYKAPECTKPGNIAYWRCPDCKKYYADEDLTVVIEKADTVIPAIHDGLKTNPDAIEHEYLPTCDTDGLVIYSCPVDGCEEGGEYTISKYTKHVYYNDVKTVAAKKAILVALEYDAEDWSDARVEAKWAALGEVKFNGEGEGKVWTGYVPATCEKNATVTYICLNNTFSYVEDEYVFVDCAVATETTLSGEGFAKLGHTFADQYPVTHSTKPGQDAFEWDGGLAASCKTVGRKISYCINEYYDEDGDLVSCDKSEIKGVAALGHNYVAFDAADIDAEAEYTVKGETAKKSGEALVALVAASSVNCMEDGKAYTVCHRCKDVQFTTVTSAGTEHVWVYFNNKGDYAGTTYVDGVKVEGTGTLAEAYGNASCEDTVKVYRACGVEGCKAGLDHVAYTLPAVGHKFADTTDKDVVAAIKAGTYANATLVKAGSCENGATYKLVCENDGCSMPKSFEIKEGFGGGHVKTYRPNTSVAATCENGYTSNEWYCANEGCEYYGYIKNDGTPVMPSEYGVDVTTGTTHEIWDAKKEAYVAVTYKNVPDANVSGAADLTAAGKVEAPVVDGKVVRYVAIEGTSYVWVYAFESKDCNVASVEAGFLFCVDCGDYDVFEADGHDYEITYDEESTCEKIGYTEYTCKDCFDTYVEDIDPVDEHEYTVVLATVEATCDRAGYVIKACEGCDKVLTTAIKALGHVVGEAELTSSCLNTLTTRKCTRCFTTIAKAHNFNENGMCVECGATK